MTRFAVHAIQDQPADGVVAIYKSYAEAYLVMCALGQLYKEYDFRVAPEAADDRVHHEAYELMSAAHYYVCECVGGGVQEPTDSHFDKHFRSDPVKTEDVQGCSDMERHQIAILMERSIGAMFPAGCSSADLPF
jgi:hypothetical protein